MTFEVRIKTADQNAIFDLEFNGQKITVNPFMGSATFTYEQEGEYDLIVSKRESKPIGIGKKLVYWLLGLLEAIIMVILEYANNDEDWYYTISPYTIKKKFKVTPDETKGLCLIFKKGNIHTMPILEHAIGYRAKELSCEFIEDREAFRVALFHRIRKVTSACIFAYLLFGFFAVMGIIDSNPIFTAFSCAVVAFAFIVNIFVVAKSVKTTESLKKVYETELKGPSF